ncbi:MAG: hypothetical protein IPI35_03470 [Deltaproteobacteria bacterium]|nr:hypothetical protein [Deltaproteobacteria bacterium]
MRTPFTALILFFTIAPLTGCKDAPGDDSAAVEVDCSTRPLTLPSARGEVGGAWDAVNGRLVLFGGDQGVPVNCASQTEFVAETWAFHPDCDNFAPIVAEGPSARGRGAVAGDGTHLYAHGGRFRDGTSGAYTLHDDLWALDYATDTWTLLAESGPGKRTNHVMVAARGQLFLYGGNSSTNGASFTPLSDLWSFDLTNKTWTLLQEDAGPGERLFHSAAISPDERTLYVYGGGDERAFTGPFFGDLWALDLDSMTWTELSDGRESGAPAARIWAGLHGLDGQVLLWAGHDDGKLGNTNELWTFDLGAGAWTSVTMGDTLNSGANGFCDFPADFVTPDLDAPERRNAMVSALDGDGKLWTFGGKTDCGIINDVWSLELGSLAWSSRSKATTGEICQRAFAECETLCY